MSRLDLDRLRSDLTQHAEAVAIALLGKPATRSRGELRYGRKGSLAIALAGKPAGLWRDHETGTGGDLLALIQRERSCDFPAAVTIASELLSERYDEAPRREPPRELTPEQRRHLALELFEAAKPIGLASREIFGRDARHRSRRSASGSRARGALSSDCAVRTRPTRTLFARFVPRH
jgi:hypothetical protein